MFYLNVGVGGFYRYGYYAQKIHRQLCFKVIYVDFIKVKGSLSYIKLYIQL